MLSVNATVNYNITIVTEPEDEDPQIIKMTMRISAPNARIYKMFERHYIMKDKLERKIMDYLKDGKFQILFKDPDSVIGIERINHDDFLLINHGDMQLIIRVSIQEIKRMFEIETEDDEHLARECAI